MCTDKSKNKNIKMKKKKVCAYTALALALAQVVLVLASWLVTAAMPEVFDHSLLSPGGIRWFFGKFQDNLASPLLVWLLLASIAWGAWRGSGLGNFDASEYRQRIAMRLVVAELVVLLAVIAALTLVPHAILLNVMGGLIPSSFTSSIVPYVSFAVVAMSISFGMMSGKLRGVEDIFDVLTEGIARMSPFFLLYVLVSQLFYSFLYVISTLRA